MHERTAEDRFNTLDRKRSGLLARCEEYAKITLPYLFPESSYDESNDSLQYSRHSIGAQAVNNLANKMMLALFQPANPFFRLSLTAKAAASIKGTDMEGKVEDSLAEGERSAMREMAKGMYRPALFELMKHLIVTGNGCPVFHKDGTLSIISLRNYVVQRSPDGTLLELVHKRPITLSAVDPAARKAYETAGGSAQEDDDVVHWYHWIKKSPDSDDYTVTQYIDKVRLPTEYDSKYKSYDDLPYQPQVWVLPTESHYGIGLVEEYHGDLQALNIYAEAQTDGAAMAATWRLLKNPTGEMRVEELANSENGDVIVGRADELTLFTAPVAANVQQISAILSDTARRVGQGFLMMTSVSRDAERVTAEEIRILASELETGLGGVYARMAVSLQLPMAKFLFERIEIPLADTDLETTIITGMEALSRQVELDKMQQLIASVAQIAQLPPQSLVWFKEEALYDFLAAGFGLERGKFVRTSEEVQQIQQQQAQQQLAMQAAMQQQGEAQ